MHDILISAVASPVEGSVPYRVLMLGGGGKEVAVVPIFSVMASRRMGWLSRRGAARRTRQHHWSRVATADGSAGVGGRYIGAGLRASGRR